MGAFWQLAKVEPYQSGMGTERGQPVDRYYIEKFLAKHAGDIHGRVLEIGVNTYTNKFGKDKVEESVVLHVAEQNEHVTLIGSLTDPNSIPTASFDCLIITQTLQLILTFKKQ
jgi:hypothetical protein